MNECIVSDGLNGVFVVEKCNEICANTVRVGTGERAREYRIASDASRGTTRGCRGSTESRLHLLRLAHPPGERH